MRRVLNSKRMNIGAAATIQPTNSDDEVEGELCFFSHHPLHFDPSLHIFFRFFCCCCLRCALHLKGFCMSCSTLYINGTHKLMRSSVTTTALRVCVCVCGEVSDGELGIRTNRTKKYYVAPSEWYRASYEIMWSVFKMKCGSCVHTTCAHMAILCIINSVKSNEWMMHPTPNPIHTANALTVYVHTTWQESPRICSHEWLAISKKYDGQKKRKPIKIRKVNVQQRESHRYDEAILFHFFFYVRCCCSHAGPLLLYSVMMNLVVRRRQRNDVAKLVTWKLNVNRKEMQSIKWVEGERKRTQIDAAPRRRYSEWVDVLVHVLMAAYSLFGRLFFIIFTAFGVCESDERPHHLPANPPIQFKCQFRVILWKFNILYLIDFFLLLLLLLCIFFILFGNFVRYRRTKWNKKKTSSKERIRIHSRQSIIQLRIAKDERKILRTPFPISKEFHSSD